MWFRVATPTLGRALFLAGGVALVLACGGADEVPDAEPCAELLPIGSTPDGCFSAFQPGETVSVARHLAPLQRTPGEGAERMRTLPLGVEIQVVGRAGEPATVDGHVNSWLEVETEGERGYVFGAWVSPLAGHAWRARTDEDVPWAVRMGPLHEPLLTVVSQGEAQELGLHVSEELSGGTLEVRVERWGDLEPLFLVGLCSIAEEVTPRCRTAEVTFVEGKLTQLSPPDAHRFEPVILDEDPDCAAAKPLIYEPQAAEELLELTLPPFRDEDAQAARCARVGEAEPPGGAVAVCAHGTRQVAFVIEEPGRWKRLACGSDPTLELDRLLAHEGIGVVEVASPAWAPSP